MSTNQSEMQLALNDSPKELQKLQEFNTDAAMMRAIHEVQGAIIVAKKFPRNEDQAYQALMKSCQRPSFAERVEYSYPRGKKLNPETGKWEDNIVSGPSVYLSREMTRLWGNINVGTEIIREDEDSRHLRSFAWDIETNTKRFAEVTFRKLIQRKKKEKDPKTGKMKDVWPPQTEWVRPDERDLRELSNKQSAITERNCSLQVLPYDFVDDCRKMARETLAKGATEDPEGTRKKVLLAFGALNVSADALGEYLGHSIASCSPSELVELRKLYVAISEGQTTWTEIMDLKTSEIADTVTLEQANSFFATYQKNGYTPEDATAFLKENFKITDSRKIPVEGFAKAMEWASKGGERPGVVIPKGEVISPNAAAPPERTENITASSESEDLFMMNRLEQLFDIDGTKPKVRESLKKQYACRIKDLVNTLESSLPQD